MGVRGGTVPVTAYQLDPATSQECRDCAQFFTQQASGGKFGIYDVMRVGPGEVVYPLPWAATSATSLVAEPAHYRQLLAKPD